MSSRTTMTALVLAILAFGSVSLSSPTLPEGESPELADSSSKVIVYYFYTSARCATCRKLESFAQEVLEQDFSTELEDGNLEWRTVNTDESGNEHFIQDYDLLTKALVLVEMNGQDQVNWRNLDRIWELVWDKEDYQNYVRSELKGFMETN